MAKKEEKAKATEEQKSEPEAEKQEPIRKVGQKKVIDVNRGTPEVIPAVENAGAAMALFKAKYALPAGTDVAYVTEDGNVFYANNESSARAHARDKKLKLYIIKP